MIDQQFDGEITGQRAGFDNAIMDDEIAELFLRVGDTEFDATCANAARVAELASGFSIKWRLV